LVQVVDLYMVNILVIGGGGYVGSYLVSQLIATGRKLTVLGRSKNPRYKLPKSVEYVEGDFAEQQLIRTLLDTHQEVIHLAYATVPNTSFENPISDLLQNLPATVQLFLEAAQKQVKLILVSSGGTVYGEASELPIRETHPRRPISPYGVTKLTVESYAHLYAVTHGLKFVCVRPANAYGVGQRPFIGQGFIATAIASAIKGMPIKIFGQNGTVRDYIYVSDLASGIVSALDHGHLSETYNIGSGIGLSNLEIVESLKPLMDEIGHEVRIKNLAERAFDVRANVLDSTKLKINSGWKPVIKFNEGLIVTRDWLVRHLT